MTTTTQAFNYYVGIDWASDSYQVCVVDEKGTVEKSPKTEEDWARIRIGGTTLAEGAYLLKVPRPFAPPGDENNSTGPDAVELSPAQILAKIKRDPVEWNARIEALRNVGLQVLDIVKLKSKDMNANDEEAAFRIISGTARSMGIEVIG